VYAIWVKEGNQNEVLFPLCLFKEYLTSFQDNRQIQL